MEDFVIYVTIPPGGNRVAFLTKIIMELEPHGVFMDGCHHGMEKEASMFKTFLQNPRTARVEFLGATTSMTSDELFFFDSAKFESCAWDLDDYTDFIHHIFTHLEGTSLGTARLQNLRCAHDAGMGDVIAAVERKYLVAGHSCRFMFDYSEGEIIQSLTKACERVGTKMTHSERSSQTVNTLVVKRRVEAVGAFSTSLVPVSMAAAVLMHKYNLLEERHSVLFLGTLEAAKVRHWPMLGWHFEQDVFDRLKAHTTPAATGPPARDKVSQVSLAHLMENLSLHQEATLQATPRFELLEMSTAEPAFHLPNGGSFVLFDDWKHFVTIVAAHDGECGPLWLIPLYYANPFFDFALATSEVKGQVQIYSFQITVSATHSCNALVMQLISNELHLLGVELVGVTHRAVLPSAELARKFRFKTGENLEKSQRTLRSAVAPPPERRMRSNVNDVPHCEDPDQDLSEADVEVVSTASSRWTTVTVAESHLFLKDAFFAAVFK